MTGFELQVKNLPEVQRRLNELAQGAQAIHLKTDRIVSDVPYAYGQNYGRYRNGRLARKAGPTYFFEKGVEEIEKNAYRELSEAWLKGPTMMRSAWANVVKRGIKAARDQAPVRTGHLRDSIHAAEGGRA